MTTERTCRYLPGVNVLVITTPTGAPRKDGTRRMKTSVYVVTDLHPDKRCADPAYRLEKLTDGRESWEIHVDKHGPNCSCGHSNFRGQNTEECCKHIMAARKVGLV